MAGSIGGFSGRNSFGLRAEMLSRHWERGLEMLADCILSPAFADEEVEKERRQVLEEIRTQEDNVSSEAFRLFSQALYPQPSLSARRARHARVGGRPRSQRRIADYYRRYIAPSQMTLAIVGDVDPQSGRDKGARAVRSAGERAAPTPDAPPPPWTPAHRASVAQQLVPTAEQAAGARRATASPAPRSSIPIASRSRCCRRSCRGRAAASSSSCATSAASPTASAPSRSRASTPATSRSTSRPSPENLPVAVTGIEDELGKIAATPVPKAELERAKRYLVGAHEISLQRRAALASTLAFHESYGARLGRVSPLRAGHPRRDRRRRAARRQEVPRSQPRHRRHGQAGGDDAGAGQAQGAAPSGASKPRARRQVARAGSRPADSAPIRPGAAARKSERGGSRDCPLKMSLIAAPCPWTPPSSKVDPLIGRHHRRALPRARTIGRGGMGAVYRVEHLMHEEGAGAQAPAPGAGPARRGRRAASSARPRPPRASTTPTSSASPTSAAPPTACSFW